MERARRSIRALMDLAPKEALVRRDGKELVVPVEDVDIGDIMIVKPGQKIAMDGNVVSGVSAVNQAAITGESIPVEKAAGDRVFAGTLNGEGVLEVEVTRRAEDTTISRIIHLVEEAQAEKAPSQAFVDRFAKYYTPAIMAAAIGVAVIPPWFGGNWETWIYRGLALLVVGCPCALVISTPVSFVTAIGNAARNGVLIKGGIYLEQAADIHTIAFDKTGTLTKGMPEVTDFIRLDGPGERELLGMAAAIERMSHHPLASAIVRKAEAEGIAPEQFQAEHVRSVTGKGAAAVVNGAPYRIGSPAMWTESVPNAVNEGLQREIQRLEQQGKTVMLFGREDAVLAVIAAADEVRESGIRVVRELKRLGVAKTVMLTGDNRVASGAIGSRIGVDETRAELMPEDKLTAVRALKAEGRTAMVGDGVNDAPALAAADVGIAMGGAGSDSALETADIALMGDDLSKLPYTIRLARRTLAVIRQNIAFSLGIKALALALIAPGWLTLWMAIFADMGATLIVTLNALRLVRTR
jgi:Cd2+/Zn2+-exporting ATPase